MSTRSLNERMAAGAEKRAARYTVPPLTETERVLVEEFARRAKSTVLAVLANYRCTLDHRGHGEPMVEVIGRVQDSIDEDLRRFGDPAHEQRMREAMLRLGARITEALGDLQA